MKTYLLDFAALSLAVVLAGCVSPPSVKPTPSAQAGGEGFDREKIANAASLPSASRPASNLERVVWLGISTTVIDAELPQRFPVLARADGTGSVSSLFTSLDTKIQARLASDRQFSGFDVIGPTDEQRPSDIGMALLVNKERWREERTYENKYLWEYGILGQLVFIDQQKQEICSSYPFGLRLRNISDSAPTPQQIAAVSRQTLLGMSENSGDADSFLGLFFKNLQRASVSIRADYCFDVGKVSISTNCLSPCILSADITDQSLV